MFERRITPTFCDTWYRVAKSRPRLSPHVHVTRQRFGRGIAYVLEEPATGTYHRMSEAAYRFAGMLDGNRTVDDAWEACAAQLGDESPTQKECIELLAQLDSSGLLIGDVPIWADMLEHRQAREVQTRRRKRHGNGLFACIPLINPDHWLEQSRHLYAWAFSWTGLALWCVSAVAAIWSLATNVDRFSRELRLDSLLDPGNLAILAGVFIVLRAVHELGHAMACKAMGGRCTEIGLMLVALVLPLPYCDATSSWRFTETWRRILVAAAGVLFESVIAAGAAILWANSEPGVMSSICYNVMIVSGVSTLLFNLNPLLRYDGYYILSDLLGIPNLAQRAVEMLKYIVVRYAFSVQTAKPPTVTTPAEAAIVLAYGVLSLPYRVLIAASICLAVSTQYSSLGLILAVLAASLMLVWPVLKGIGYLLWSPALLGRRARANGVVMGVLVVAVVTLGIIPVQDRIYAPGWIVPTEHRGIRTLESGYVSEILIRVGDQVRSGQPLLRLENAEVEAGRTIAAAQLAQAITARDEAAMKSPSEARTADANVRVATEALRRAEERVASLTLAAPSDGTVIASGASGADWDDLLGSYITKGTLLAHVSSLDQLQVRTLVDDREFGHAFSAQERIRASIKIRGMASHVASATLLRVSPIGSREIENPAVSSAAGGEIVATRSGENSIAALTPQFWVDLASTDLPDGVMAGQRVRVRFGIGDSPLMTQWLRRATQFWMSRFGA
ncbi:MAG: PqqD family peptide modification chaperone [Phycisphaeraceae bacterium]|nr:PqqD family peptide modification chaperone [Phycisphaeraceae bacterium]